MYCGSTTQKNSGKKKGMEYTKRYRRLLQMQNTGLVPSDIMEEFKGYQQQKPIPLLSHLQKPKIQRQRQLEGRTMDCDRMEVMPVDLRGLVFQPSSIMKLPKEKKKNAQYEKGEKEKTQTHGFMHPLMKSSLLRVSSGPYILSCCCSRMHGYGLTCWGPNGYTCGGCMPKSNINRQMTSEILCASCLAVVPNRPMIQPCKHANCQLDKSRKERCRHAASPILTFDDVYTQKMGYQYYCDDCFRTFRTDCGDFVILSAVISKSPELIKAVVLHNADL
jgi:hypothetical protein